MAKHSTLWRRLRTWGVPPVCVIAGLALGIGYMQWRGPSATDPASALASAATTRTASASLETIEKSVSASGTLVASDDETLAFAASGKVTAVKVAVGDTVAKGDVLATIDNLQLTADLASAKSDLADAEATYADLKDAADGSDASDAKIASAKANVKLKKEAVADAKDAMADAELVAPFDGLVTAVSYSVGDAVGSGSGGSMGGGSAASSGASSSGITVIGQDQWTVTASLTADEVPLIATGDQVTFTADNVDQFYGIVTDISALPSTSSGTAVYPVTLTVTGSPEGLFEGISVTADIVYLRKTDVLTVPTNAITTADGVSTVTVVADDSTEETRTVTLGESSGSLTEITDGLSEGENVKVTVFAQGGSGSGGSDGGFQFPTDGVPGGGQFPGGDLNGGSGGFQRGTQGRERGGNG